MSCNERVHQKGSAEPSEMVLRRNCIPKLFDDIIEAIEVSVNETIDVEQRYVANFVFRTFVWFVQ